MNLPNHITLVRILLIPLFLTLIIYFSPGRNALRLWALAVFLAAVTTDALDGYIARRFNLRTKLGTFLDPLADKLLLVIGFLGITFSPFFIVKPPSVVVIVIVFRDLLIVGGLIVIYLTTGTVEVRPNFLGKVVTVCQMASVIALLLESVSAIPICYITAALTAASAVVYTTREIRKLNGRAAS